MKKYFKLFFGKFFLIGLAIILISCVIDAYDSSSHFIITILTNVLSTIGIALMVGAVFDFSKNSEDFTIFISNILKKIIVTKEFLGEMENEEKKNILEMLITPSNSQIEQYSSINSYYKKSIESFSNLYNQPFKTNVTIQIVAKIKNNKVICEGHVSHRRYKINGKYQPIETTFEKTDSKILNTYVLTPDGVRHNLVENDDIDVKESKDLKIEKIGKRYITYIPDKFNGCPYITLCKEIEEIGYDHWTVFNWSSLTPCDGICFELRCLDNLIIKEYKVFDNPKLYEININDDKDTINILSSSWLNEYTGFTLTISKK